MIIFHSDRTLMCRYSGYLLMRLMYGVRTAEAMLASQLITQIRMAEMFAKIISEHSGIVCAAAIFSFGRITGTDAHVLKHASTAMKLPSADAGGFFVKSGYRARAASRTYIMTNESPYDDCSCLLCIEPDSGY